MSNETEVKETETAEAEEGSLPFLMQSIEGSPDQSQIDAWKLEFGEVFVSGFSDTEMFIWRALKRPEWTELQGLAANPEAQIGQHKFEELICDTCVLWRSVSVNWDQGKAGTPSSLHEQILQNSNFLNPQAAAILVAKL